MPRGHKQNEASRKAFRKFELLSRVLNARAVSHPHHMRIDTGADVHLHGIYPAEA